MSDRLTDQEIADALKVCEKATEGPWEIDDGDLTLGHWGDEWEPIAEPPSNGRDAVDIKRDLEFCALARTLLPRALAELQEARKDTDRLDWLTQNEYQLRSHREKCDCGYTVWWTVTTRRGASLSHPYGKWRAAIDKAREYAKE